jgi:hypothetical protein
LRRRRPGIGFNGKQIGNRIAGSRQLEVGRVYHSLDQRSAAGDLDGLSAMMSFIAPGASGLSRLRSAEIFRAWQFIAGVVDHVVALRQWRGIGTHLGNFERQNDDDKDRKRFGRQGHQHVSVGRLSNRGLACQAGCRTRHCRADRGDKILPARRPFHK